MNREEILARSQKENKNQLDERSKNIQTKANSISQGVGMAMCILLGAVGMGARRDHAFLFLALALYWCMFAAERLACAAMEKIRVSGFWLLSSRWVLWAAWWRISWRCLMWCKDDKADTLSRRYDYES